MSESDSTPFSLRRISAATVEEICDLSATLSEAQRGFVANNSLSIAQAHFSEDAWFRAIYAGDTPVGFVMLHLDADWDDGIDCAGAFLWRLMIAGPHQGCGYGRAAVADIVRRLAARGQRALYTSCGLGAAGPYDFYRRLGFEPTGGRYDDEVELRLAFASGNAAAFE